jgi:ABC-type transport system involved in cytochrome c biogenesis permease subunit
MVVAAVEASLVVAAALLRAGVLSAAAYITAVALAAAVIGRGYLTYLPFHSPAMNQFKCAMAFVLAWAVACMIIAQVRQAAEVRTSTSH